MTRYTANVCRGMKQGRVGWVLRWYQYENGKSPGTLLSHWFVDEQEALAVRNSMRAGLSFEEAFHQMWTT